MSLGAIRAKAAAALAETGFPGVRDEAWKFTATRGWARREPLARPGPIDLSDRWYIREDVPRLVFVDGHLDASWSRSPGGVEAIDRCPRLGELLPGDSGFAASSLADFAGGAWVNGGGELLLVHVGTGAGVASVRHRLEVPAGQRLSVVTWFEGPADALVVAGTEVQVGEEAALSWVDLQDVRGHAVHQFHGRVARGGSVDGGLVGLGAAVARVEVALHLEEASRVSLVGLALGRASQHQDFHTLLHHDGPGSVSRQQFKAILGDSARGVYSGRVVVGGGVAGCDVGQRSAALLLSDRAIANSRPQLEIHCDDVAATHGSTVGQLDAEAMFFLAARGLDPRAASALLTTAFAAEILDRLPVERVRTAIRSQVESWLGGEA